MSSCNIYGSEIETEEEADWLLKRYNNTLKVLKQDKQILPNKILNIINAAVNLDEIPSLCFCKIKKRGWRNRWEKEWNSTVYLYTSNLWTVEEFIGQVSGKYFGIVCSVLPQNQHFQPVPEGEYFRIGISYKELVPFLIKNLEQEIQELIDYKNDSLVIG